MHEVELTVLYIYGQNLNREMVFTSVCETQASPEKRRHSLLCLQETAMQPDMSISFQAFKHLSIDAFSPTLTIVSPAIIMS